MHEKDHHIHHFASVSCKVAFMTLFILLLLKVVVGVRLRSVGMDSSVQDNEKNCFKKDNNKM